MRKKPDARRYVSLGLGIAVFFVFAGAALLRTMPADVHGCGHGPCAAEQTSVDFCIAHCLNAAQAGHGMASSVIVLTLGVFAVLAAYQPLSSLRRRLFHVSVGVRGAFPPLLALQTVVLRE